MIPSGSVKWSVGVNAMEEVGVKSLMGVATSFILPDTFAAIDEEEESVAEFGVGSSGHSLMGLLAKSASAAVAEVLAGEVDTVNPRCYCCCPSGASMNLGMLIILRAMRLL